MASFFDPEHAPRRKQVDWQTLADAGLSQVIIGLETGVPELRLSIGKSDQLKVLSDAIALIKQAGIRVALTLLMGIGKQAEATYQREITTAFIGGLELDARDIVYLSPLTGSDWRDLDQHQDAFKRFINQHSNARTRHYNMEKFHYYC